MNHIKRVNIFALIITFVWIASIIFSILNNLNQIDKKKDELLLNHAKNAFKKDMMFRKWVAMHGGVYVKPTEQTPSNPYLAHIKNRDVVTTDGMKLTLMNPAYTIRQLMENFSGMYGEKGRITSLKVLNPNNKADKWETSVLKDFEKKDTTEFYETTNFEGKEHFRYMGALTTKESCLKCHGKQGYKVGDIRGGVSISIPTDNYINKVKLEKKYVISSHVIFLLVTLIIGFLVYKRVLISTKKELALDKKLHEKEELLHEQSKMASLGEMLGNIAHQWRQPLSMISTAASGMKIEKEFGKLTDEKFEKTMDDILNSTQYLSQTIDDFRYFMSANNSVILFDLKEHIRKILSLMAGTLKFNHIEIIEDMSENIELKSFPNELTQAIMNILNNAKDAFDDKNIEKKLIFIETKEENSNIEITFKDNARGIPEDIISKVFEPYFTTKHKSRGTGLGLYMTYKIINESLKGQITVKNVEFEYEEQEYTGAEFKITIPLD